MRTYSSVCDGQNRLLRFKFLLQAPYSLDLASSDRFLFENLKKWLNGRRFANNDSVVDGYFEELVGSFYKQGV